MVMITRRQGVLLKVTCGWLVWSGRCEKPTLRILPLAYDAGVLEEVDFSRGLRTHWVMLDVYQWKVWQLILMP
ncbi:hypothetical protein BKA66DRAFT_457465 [Pyrenochaeta sp. MPI-SDFR-AT-0127]|nr:hypothetical protein BKA66DRAFT_457465 [Pyrenochaeta sp. MPI-SDFR-AT-0127]